MYTGTNGRVELIAYPEYIPNLGIQGVVGNIVSECRFDMSPANNSDSIR